MRSDTGPFAIVPMWLVYAGASSAALHIYAVLAGRYADKTGRAWPKRATLAEETCLSVRAVDRAITELIEKGALIRERRWREGGGATSSMLILCYTKPGQPGKTDGADAKSMTAKNDTHALDHEKHDCQKRHSYYESMTAKNDTHAKHDCQKRHVYEDRFWQSCPSVPLYEPDPIEPDKSARDLFSAFADRWQTRYGSEYHFVNVNREKIAKAFNALLTKLGYNECLARMDRFFASTKKYLLENNHALNIFLVTVNDYVEPKATTPTTTVEAVLKSREKYRE